MVGLSRMILLLKFTHVEIPNDFIRVRYFMIIVTFMPLASTSGSRRTQCKPTKIRKRMSHETEWQIDGNIGR